MEGTSLWDPEQWRDSVFHLRKPSQPQLTSNFPGRSKAGSAGETTLHSPGFVGSVPVWRPCPAPMTWFILGKQSLCGLPKPNRPGAGPSARASRPPANPSSLGLSGHMTMISDPEPTPTTDPYRPRAQHSPLGCTRIEILWREPAILGYLVLAVIRMRSRKPEH